MKPFNFEAAKAGAKLVTRAGREVADFHHFQRDKSKQSCVAYIGDNDHANWFRTDGRYNLNGNESENDLFMAHRCAHGVRERVWQEPGAIDRQQ